MTGPFREWCRSIAPATHLGVGLSYLQPRLLPPGAGSHREGGHGHLPWGLSGLCSGHSEGAELLCIPLAAGWAQPLPLQRAQFPHLESGDSKASLWDGTCRLCKQTYVCIEKRKVVVNFKLFFFFESQRASQNHRVHMDDQGFGVASAIESLCDLGQVT